MKRLLSLAALFLSVLAAPFSDSILAEWDEYKAAHDKFYQTPEENARRLEIYIANKRMVEEHNSKYHRGETTFTMAINKFSDWLPEELDRLFGLKVNTSRRGGRIYQPQPDIVVPDSINWVKKGAVTTVKDQGRCGSCYAFSAAGALEALMFRTNRTITSLSAQELMECGDNLGCDGGHPVNCYLYAGKYGVETDKDYPYEAVEKGCRAEKGKAVMNCNGYTCITPGDEKAMKAAVGTVGPVSIAMGVTLEFAHYQSGVYDGSCSNYPNHALLAVGYGTDEQTGKKYWLVKNSWGSRWGERGYVKMIRNENKCFIADDTYYPMYI